MKKTIGNLLAVLLVAGSLSSPSWAGRKVFPISPSSVSFDDGGSYHFEPGHNAGIRLDDTGTEGFGFSFQIPGNYMKNSPIRISIHWHHAIGGCDIVLEPSFVARSRVGSDFTGQSDADGLEPADGSNLLTPPANGHEVSVKTYLLKPTAAMNQLPRDFVHVGFRRDSNSGSDTCTGEFWATGILVSYRTR